MPGNELADQAAKEATNGSETSKQAHDIYQLHAPLKLAVRRRANENWCRSWTAETRGRILHSIVPTSTPNTLILHSDLPKALSAVLVQMCTGKIRLKSFLFEQRVPDIEDPLCECGYGEQTVLHVLLQCRRYIDLRQRYRISASSHDLATILSEPQLARRAARFIIQTKLLPQYEHMVLTDE